MSHRWTEKKYLVFVVDEKTNWMPRSPTGHSTARHVRFCTPRNDTSWLSGYTSKSRWPLAQLPAGLPSLSHLVHPSCQGAGPEGASVGREQQRSGTWANERVASSEGAGKEAARRFVRRPREPCTGPSPSRSPSARATASA
eukprot:6621539-Prymnesium_polylepis.1